MPSAPRVAFIGAGHWHAARHLAALRQAGAAVVGVSEHDAAVAERVGRQGECPWFTDAAALLDTTRPDFVFARPRHVDAPAVAADLIERGLPFAIEKPLGLSAAAIEPLVARARARGVFTAVPFINRYSPLWGEVARLRQAGALAPLVHAHVRIINGPPRRYIRDGVGWMLDPALSGGGALRNLGIHAADAVGWLTGEPVAVVAAAVSRRLYDLPIEEFATALLRTPSGVTATVEAGYTHPRARGCV
jgi:predicted dehydrogenase